VKITYTLGDGIDRHMEVDDDSEIARLIIGPGDKYSIAQPTEYFVDGFIFDEKGTVTGYYEQEA
jgi:hypothetical protein